jgi:hypothetical protein
MSDARWADVGLDVEDACKHFTNAAAIFDGGGFDQDGLAGYIRDMALMHAMQSGHTSMEGALLRVLDILGEDKPTGDRWHEDLIRRVARPLPGSKARPAILSPEAAADADETRRFRNKATRGYNSFVASRAAPAIEAARRLVEALSRDIARFQQEIDPPSDDAEDDIGADQPKPR